MIPKEAKKKKDNHLAEGEVTGHYHNAVGENTTVLEHEQDLYLDTDGCSVTHQEHKTIDVIAGKYKVEKVQEFDHAEQEARRVID